MPQGNIKADLRQGWGDWLSELGERAGGWEWWVTMTFREPPANAVGWTKIGWGYSGKAWDTLINEIGLRKGMHDLWWVRGREYQQWRGVPHFHGLIGGVGDLRRMDLVDWCWRKYGMTRILPYNRELGAGYYLCKYVTKELGDIQFSSGLTR